MSLFDVLRYPIHEPPLPGQILSVPSAIFDEWAPITGWKFENRGSNDQEFVDTWFQLYYASGHKDKSGLELLRKMIQEYQE